MRKKIPAALKARIALEALREQHTIGELATKYGVHPNQITMWKKQATDNFEILFEKPQKNLDEEHEKLTDELYKQLGQKNLELEFLKKAAKKLGVI